MAEENQQVPKKVIVEYPDMDQVSPAFVNGAFGFVAKDTLTMHFYAENVGYADRSEHGVVSHEHGFEAEQMQASPSPIDPDGNFHLIRRNVCSVVMTKQVLTDTVRWLQQKLSEMEGA